MDRFFSLVLAYGRLHLTARYLFLSRQRAKLFFLSATVILLATAVSFILSNRPSASLQDQSIRYKPPDVVSTVDQYTYSVNATDYSITLTGRKIVRRGVRFMGVRSNVLNKNYFEQIKGGYQTSGKALKFEAASGEWDLDVGRPLKLMRNVRIELNDRTIEASKVAIIDFWKGVIEVDGGKKVLF